MSEVSTENSVRIPATFEIIKAACDAAGYTPSLDRKASLTYGLSRLLGDEYGTHMIMRSHAVQSTFRKMMDAETTNTGGSRQLNPRGVTFGDVHKTVGSQQFASALLSWLMTKGLVFRGLELECSDCGTRAWYSLDDVGDLFRCIGCQASQHFDARPHDAAWRYRINQLLASSIDQGILPGILAAYDLGVRFGTAGAYVLPNVILSNSETGKPEVEFDLLGFEDGEWIGAECKSWGDVTAAELINMRTSLERIGIGTLMLVRASTTDSSSDSLVDQVKLWDHQPLEASLVDDEMTMRFLNPRRI